MNEKMKARIGIFFAIAGFILIPGMVEAKTYQSCVLGTHDTVTQRISSVTCDGISEWTVSYGANMSYWTWFLAIGVSSEKANWWNCTYTDTVPLDWVITNVECPSYGEYGTWSTKPEEWGNYIKLHLLAGIWFVLICLLPYLLILVALWFWLKYGFYFFDTPKNATKK